MPVRLRWYMAGHAMMNPAWGGEAGDGGGGGNWNKNGNSNQGKGGVTVTDRYEN